MFVLESSGPSLKANFAWHYRQWSVRHEQTSTELFFWGASDSVWPCHEGKESQLSVPSLLQAVGLCWFCIKSEMEKQFLWKARILILEDTHVPANTAIWRTVLWEYPRSSATTAGETIFRLAQSSDLWHSILQESHSSPALSLRAFWCDSIIVFFREIWLGGENSASYVAWAETLHNPPAPLHNDGGYAACRHLSKKSAEEGHILISVLLTQICFAKAFSTTSTHQWRSQYLALLVLALKVR